MSHSLRLVATTVPCAPGFLAKQILSAMETGDLAGLEEELELAERLAAEASAPSAVSEQFDLLGALTGQIRRSIRRFRHRLTPGLDEIDVPVRLLRHLAGLERRARPAQLSAESAHNAASARVDSAAHCSPGPAPGAVR